MDWKLPLAGFLDEILQTLVPLVVQLLGLDLKLFHGDEILNERLPEGAADHLILRQRLQSVVELHGNGEVLLPTGGFAQAAGEVQVPPDAVQARGHGGPQHHVRVGHGRAQLVVDPRVAYGVRSGSLMVLATWLRQPRPGAIRQLSAAEWARSPASHFLPISDSSPVFSPPVKRLPWPLASHKLWESTPPLDSPSAAKKPAM
ncbi:hypothetical protein EYF80_054769 [Liparis tanakae]|uniref:Uncharacterized protein n=1 Tax=Liparis tanakae TaxID=230148 RepID=A0A4Z2F306_9TELE|nr:hypothetical protein EYF80_054769 [Liparis tanakae]